MNTLKLYLRSMGILLKCQMQYPLSFMLQTLAQLIMEGGEMLAVILLVDRFDHLNQWNAGDLYFFFGLMSVTFYLTECFGRGITGNFPYMVRTGQLDLLLTHPRGILTQVMCSAVDPRRISCIAVGTVSLVLGSRMAEVRWSPQNILLFAESVFCGFWLVLGLFLIEAVLCIHSVKSVEIANALTYGGRSACQYPVDVFPRPLRMLFTVIAPFALVMHVPASVILGKPVFGWPAWAAWISPLSGFAVFGFMVFLFSRSMRFYRSAGS
ncbi:MAG: ABC-2 family transporter protein [Clostridia bacterium]|nr:ABC-2 family transporter protein [Clostridia bacterium]